MEVNDIELSSNDLNMFERISRSLRGFRGILCKKAEDRLDVDYTYLVAVLTTTSHRKASKIPLNAHVNCSVIVACKERNVG